MKSEAIVCAAAADQFLNCLAPRSTPCAFLSMSEFPKELSVTLSAASHTADKLARKHAVQRGRSLDHRRPGPRLTKRKRIEMAERDITLSSIRRTHSLTVAARKSFLSRARKQAVKYAYVSDLVSGKNEASTPRSESE